MPDENRYAAIISEIFRRHFSPSCAAFEFDRVEVEQVAKELRITLPKNIGDVLYSFRFRNELPQAVTGTASSGFEWVIELAGRGKYRFRLAALNRIVPRENLIEIKVPDATPQIIGKYALTDEQALPAKVRYNRLIDIFLGITA